MSARLEIGGSLDELAKQSEPPIDLTPFVAALRSAGAHRVYAAVKSTLGVFVEAPTAEACRAYPSAVAVRTRRNTAVVDIDWTSAKPVRAALERLTEIARDLDQLARFRFAASDMELAAAAATGLIEAEEHNGPARLFERIIETGMVVTYSRPFVAGNRAGVGAKWTPSAGTPDRKLHNELLRLRNEYYAHADHTPERALRNVATLIEQEGEGLRFVESWSRLPVWKLRQLVELATKQAASFTAEADRHSQGFSNG